jgi:hypothetical protein
MENGRESDSNVMYNTEHEAIRILTGQSMMKLDYKREEKGYRKIEYRHKIQGPWMRLADSR